MSNKKRIDPEILIMIVCALGIVVCALDLLLWRP